MKVRLMPSDETGCGWYRMRSPAAALEGEIDIEIDTTLDYMVDGSWKIHSVVAPEVDVVVAQRPCSWQWPQVIPLLQAEGIAVVVDIDDRLDLVDPGNSAAMSVHPRTSPLANFGHLAEAVRAADLVTVSTPALADHYGTKALVLENCIADEDLYRGDHRDPGVLGWPGALMTHPRDLADVGGAVARAVRDDGWRFRVVGPSDGVARALGLRDDDVPESDFVPMTEYLDRVAELGVAIAPLADTEFNRAKSWLKPLEAMAAGVPVVCSARAEYERLTALGAGLTVSRSRDWLRALRTAADPAWQEDQIGLGREVAAAWSIGKHAWKWAEAWSFARQIRPF